LDVISSAELAITASTHQEQVSLCRKQACVTTSAADLFDLAVELDLFRPIKAVFISVAQLPVDTIAPCVHLAIRVEVG